MISVLRYKLSAYLVQSARGEFDSYSVASDAIVVGVRLNDIALQLPSIKVPLRLG